MMDINVEIIWQGDLEDDCLAHWNGLLLRVEWIDDKDWWWCVYDMKNNEVQIDSSNNYYVKVIDGKNARKLAEECARNFVNKHIN